jgi:WD40 repeat protein
MDISPDHETFLLGRFTFRGSQSSLWLLPVQGGNPIRLANIESGEAVWTPDGNHILYGQDHELWIVAADGTGARLFATLPGGPHWLVWSPNGTRLRLTIDDDTGNSALWELRDDGSRLHRCIVCFRKIRLPVNYNAVASGRPTDSTSFSRRRPGTARICGYCASPDLRCAACSTIPFR